MRFLYTAAACLLCTASLAQSPQSGGPPPSGAGPNEAPWPETMPMQGDAVTQSSRVRAFNAGPDGQIRSIYLTNGSVVDMSPGFGPQVSSQIHKGVRIRIVGSRTLVNGQPIVTPQQLTIAGQSFAGQPSPRPNSQPGLIPPPNDGRGVPPPAAGGPMRAGIATPPPPPPGPGGPGMPPPPPAGSGGPGVPPPPPAGPGGPGVPAPPPPAQGSQPAPVGPAGAAGAMDSTQPVAAQPAALSR